MPTSSLRRSPHYAAHYALLQGWLTFATNATGFDRLFPGLNVRLLTLNINFKTPLWRNYLLLHGICEWGREGGDG